MWADEFLRLGDNVCISVEHAITDEDIFSSLLSTVDDGENDKKVVEKNNVPPSQLTKEELEEVISSILRTTHYSSEHGLEMHTLALLF